MASLLLNCIHYIAAILSHVRYWFYKIHVFSFHKTATSVVYSDARKLKKLPLHLGLLLFEDDISYTDIASVILWSATMGITFISIYERNGAVKRNSSTIADEIQKIKQTGSDSEHTKANIELHNGLNRPNSKHKGSPQTDVFLLSLEDGRQSIVGVAKHICRRVSDKQLKPSDATPATVDLIFQEETGYPDPDMVIRFGSVQSLLGFMPWHIRLTEILSYPSHLGINYKTFKSLLVGYGSTEQRFGK